MKTETIEVEILRIGQPVLTITGKISDEKPDDVEGMHLYKIIYDGNRPSKISTCDKKINPSSVLQIRDVSTKFFQTEMYLELIYGMDIDGDELIIIDWKSMNYDNES